MADAEGESVAREARGAATAGGAQRCEFCASGRTITFPGYLRAYVEGSDDPEAALDDQESPLPPLARGRRRAGRARSTPRGHATSPPARYTEASLVKKLEELGIGRPSTYASIIGDAGRRSYVWKKGQALVPDWVAFIVVTLHGAALLRAGRLRLHRRDGGRPRRDRRRASAAKVDFLKALLLRRREAHRPAGAGGAEPREDRRRPRSTAIPIGTGPRRRGDRGPGRPLRARTSSAARTPPPSPTSWPPTS